MTVIARVGAVISRVSRARSAKQLSLMMVITMVTQVVSIYKSSVIAANFGASTELDAFNFGSNIASFFCIIVSSGIITVLIPAYVNKAKRSSVDTVITFLFLVTGLFLLLTFILRGQIVDLITDREDQFKNYVGSTLLFSILIQMLPAALSVTTTYYQSQDRFNLPKIILMVSNLGVAAVLSIWKDFSIHGYLHILLGGAILQFAVDTACALFYGFRFRLTFDFRDKQFLEMLRMLLPAVFGTAIYSLNTTIKALISSNLGTGQLTVLSFANMMNIMINTMVIGNLSAYVFPRFVKKLGIGQPQAQRALWGSVTVFHAVVGLLVAGFLNIGREFIGLLYEHGRFTSGAADSIFYCMCLFLVGQQANIIRDLIYRYFSADGDTKSTMKNGINTCVLGVSLSLILSYWWGIYGIVAGTVISNFYSAAEIFLRFRRKYGLAIAIRPYLGELVKTEASLLMTAGVVFLFKKLYTPPSTLLSLLIFGTITVLLFLLNMRLFKMKLFY